MGGRDRAGRGRLDGGLAWALNGVWGCLCGERAGEAEDEGERTEDHVRTLHQVQFTRGLRSGATGGARMKV